MRESATHASDLAASGFDATSDRVNAAARLAAWQRAGDQRLFKLIVSPEFGERLDLTKLARELLGRIQRDQGHELEWVGVAHFNTDHPHVHIALRGFAGGHQLVLGREYIKHGIRRHAEELCTAELGFRTHTDAIEAERREIDQPRFTSLDRQISRLRGSTEGSSFQVLIDNVRKPKLIMRLAVLHRMGLAENSGAGKWAVSADFEAALRAMQRTTDRQRMVAAHAALLSDPRLPMQHTPVAMIDDIEGRLIAHSLDDQSGKVHMILESTAGRVHIIPHSPAIEGARSRALLSPGNFARLRRNTNARIADVEVTDHGDADVYLQSANSRKRVRTGNAGRKLETAYGGWLGRYQAVWNSFCQTGQGEIEQSALKVLARSRS
jgi:hypothetical protein